MKPRALLLAALAAASSLAAVSGVPRIAVADGLDDSRVNARAVARAGAVTVSDDGAAALVATPASLARRTITRASVGVVVRDDDSRHQFIEGGPRVDNQAPATASPMLFAAGGGDSWIVAASYTEGADREVQTAEPGFDQPAEQYEQLFPHRYGGTELRYQRQSLTLGGAVRAGPWLAFGASMSATRVALRQSQRLWAGFSGVAEVGNPERDLALELDGRDRFVPGAAVGALAIVGDTGLELGVGVLAIGSATLDGDARLEPTNSRAFPRVTRGQGAASAALPGFLSVRAGARYAGARFAVELNGAYRWFDDNATAWETDVAAQDQQAVPPAAVGTVPTQRSTADHWEAAIAGEVAVVPSFLWLVGGYSLRARADRATQSRVTWTNGAVHTVGAGVEVYWREVTIVASYSRGLSMAATIAENETDVLITNPFDGGTAPVGAGRFDGGNDRFALSLEIAWDPLADTSLSAE